MRDLSPTLEDPRSSPAPAPAAAPAADLVRPLGPGDASAYAEHLQRLPERDRWLLFGAIFGASWLQAYASVALGPGAVSAGAWREGRLVGVAVAALGAPGGAEVTLSVEPGFRRRGLGRDLLRRVGDVAALLGCPRASLRLAPEADEMRALALRCGASLKRDGCLAILPLPLA